MLSAVGDDDLGRGAIAALGERGVETTAVQVNKRSTGQVLVELDDSGVASYQFAEDSAWDRLEWNNQLQGLAATCDAVCFGTLGQRSEQSRDSIRAFVKSMPKSALRILDVNLRAPFYDDDLIKASLALANVLKLNDAELPLIAMLNNCHGSDVQIMQQLADKYRLRCVALTRGDKGAILLNAEAVSELPGTIVEVADTVGAGDAFTASMTLGLLARKPLDAINRNAISVASYVCSMPGATMAFPECLRLSE
jgi:fructokinase